MAAECIVNPYRDFRIHTSNLPWVQRLPAPLCLPSDQPRVVFGHLFPVVHAVLLRRLAQALPTSYHVTTTL